MDEFECFEKCEEIVLLNDSGFKNRLAPSAATSKNSGSTRSG